MRARAGQVGWYVAKRGLYWARVDACDAAEKCGQGATVRLGTSAESREWAWPCCSECRRRMTDADRGKWSPFFCVSCDVERMDRIGRQMSEILESWPSN